MDVSLRFIFALLAIIALIAACILLVAGHNVQAQVTATLFIGLVIGAGWPRAAV